jgi:hypothetical protein
MSFTTPIECQQVHRQQTTTQVKFPTTNISRGSEEARQEHHQIISFLQKRVIYAQLSNQRLVLVDDPIPAARPPKKFGYETWQTNID